MFDGEKYIGVYCHSDGYLSYNGAILLEHYNTAEKVKELISHGDMSCLGEKVNPNPDYPHSFDDRQDDVCVYYHRDRGEDWERTKPIENKNEIGFYERLQQAYNYLFDNGKWYYNRFGDKLVWKELTQEAIDKD